MKKLILIILAMLVVAAAYYSNKQLKRIVLPDIKYNTVYTSQFDQSKFNRIVQGANKADVLQVIGEPFSIINPEFEHSILYTHQDIEIEPGVLEVSLKDTIIHLKFLRINFNKSGRIQSLYNQGEFVDSTMISELQNLNYQSTIKKLGEPKQEFKCNCNCSVLIYSKLKEGKYSGKKPTIANKRIAINKNNEVQIVVDVIGNPYYKQLGLCKNIQNGG